MIAEHVAHLQLRNLRPGTIYQRRRALTRLCLHIDGDLLEATPSEIEGRLAVVPGADSRACELSHLRGFYKWAVEYEHRGDDPTRRVPRPKLARRLPRPVSEDGLRDALAQCAPRVRPWLLLAGWAGLRCVEIAQLRADHLTLDEDHPMVLVRDGKGGKDRAVPLSAWLVDQLRACQLPASGFLFLRGDTGSGPVASHIVSHIGARQLRKAGVDATMHQLRHRFGTQVHRGTGDIRVTQELMGHASPISTAIYTYVASTDTSRAVDSIPTF